MLLLDGPQWFQGVDCKHLNPLKTAVRYELDWSQCRSFPCVLFWSFYTASFNTIMAQAVHLASCKQSGLAQISKNLFNVCVVCNCLFSVICAHVLGQRTGWLFSTAVHPAPLRHSLSQTPESPCPLTQVLSPPYSSLAWLTGQQPSVIFLSSQVGGHSCTKPWLTFYVGAWDLMADPHAGTARVLDHWGTSLACLTPTPIKHL